MEVVEPPRDIYPLILEMRQAFEQILTVLQSDEQRIRHGYNLLQQERDAMGRELLEWHRHRPSLYPPTFRFTSGPPTDMDASRGDVPDDLMETPTARAAGGHRGSPDAAMSRPVSTPSTPAERQRHPAAVTPNDTGADGATEVTVDNPTHPHGAVEAEHKTASALARMPTNPPPYCGFAQEHESGAASGVRFERIVNSIDNEGHRLMTATRSAGAGAVTPALVESPAWESSASYSMTAPTAPPSAASGHLHPEHGEAKSLWSPPPPSRRPPGGTPEEDGLAKPTRVGQEELRMYAAPVHPRRLRSPGADDHSGITGGSGGGAHYGTDASEREPTLMESDRATSPTSTSHAWRRSEAEGTLVQPSAHIQALLAAARGGISNGGGGGGGYAEQLARTRATTMVTREGRPPNGSHRVDSSCQVVKEDRYSQGFWIWVWPCFGTFSATAKPARVYVYGHTRRLEDVTEKAAEQLQCKPAPQYLFEPDGKAVRSLRHLIPEQNYLLFPSGAFYREDAVPSALLHRLVMSAQSRIAERSFEGSM